MTKGPSFQDLIISAGFLNGIWFSIGFNPEDALIGALLDLLKAISPDQAFQYSFLFWLIGILALAGEIALIWSMGEWLGITALGFAFFAGALIQFIPELAIIFFIISIIIARFLD